MNAKTREILRIVVSMTGACAAGAVIIGAVFVATDRYQEAARVANERRAVVEMLSLGPEANVREVRQFLARDLGEVVYRTAAASGAGERELVFDLDGGLVRDSTTTVADENGLEPLGRIFVAREGGQIAGFVVEGESRGYKNVIRFFVAIDAGFDVAGVRVVEHEEDPGLGAETATPWFQGQYVGRRAASIDSLDVTRDPMPEDWRAALLKLERQPVGPWRSEQAALIARERGRPIYAVTGATISSRAVNDGVRATVNHFRRRWELIAPYLAAGTGERS